MSLHSAANRRRKGANLTNSTPKIDDLDTRIIDALAVDGRVPFKEIARNQGVSDGTIRARVSRLLDSGIIRVTALRNPMEQETALNAIVGMSLEKRTHKTTMEQIASLTGVLSVANVTGTYDLIAEVYLPSRDALNTFLFEELAVVEGIRSTETFVLLDAINKWIPVR